MKAINEQKTRRTIFSMATVLAASALLMLVLSGLNQPALAQDHSGHAQGKEMRVPQTAAEHRQHAEHYRSKAAEYRREAEAHRKMLTDYSKGVARNPKETLENPYIKKMRLHCEKYIKAAEDLAIEADEMARFHELRAKELEGK